VTALRNDGTLWSWGSNKHGQLGDGTTEWRLSQVQVKCPITDSKDFESRIDWKVYPNPSHDILYLNSVDNAETLKVCSINGKQYEVNIEKIDDQLFQLEVHNLSVGMYFITIGNETKRWVKF
jgi:alpha-tubulin suppressor-like RCC1 family protein